MQSHIAVQVGGSTVKNEDLLTDRGASEELLPPSSESGITFCDFFPVLKPHETASVVRVVVKWTKKISHLTLGM